MKIKNIILGRYNEIQTEIWVGVAYKIQGGGSLIYKSLKCSIVGPVSATWYPIPPGVGSSMRRTMFAPLSLAKT